MSQVDILNLLKKEKKWLSTKEIEKKLNVSNVSRPLSVLLKWGEVIKREIKDNGHWIFSNKVKKK